MKVFIYIIVCEFKIINFSPSVHKWVLKDSIYDGKEENHFRDISLGEKVSESMPQFILQILNNLKHKLKYTIIEYASLFYSGVSIIIALYNVSEFFI